MRTYYAASYPTGTNTRHANTSRVVRDVRQFLSKADRDAWVAARRIDTPTAAGYREALSASDVTDRERGAILWYSNADGSAVLDEAGAA
jgi:hypothetical protein